MTFLVKTVAPLALGLGLAASHLPTVVHASEAAFKAGSPGFGDRILSADYPIPSNYTQTCADDDSQTSQSCGEKDKLPEVIDFGIEQNAEGDSAEEVQKLIDETEDYFRKKVLVKQEYDSVREECRNRHELCSFWAHIGECEANPAYMLLQCAPACRSCEKIDIRNRCPIDPDAKKALGPGDLDKMFENIIGSEEFKKYGPTVLSRPSNPAESNEDSADYNVGPWMVLFSEFISPEEADRMIELSAMEGYKRSMDVGDEKFDGTFDDYKSSHRTSENSWCQSSCYEDPIAQSIMQRITDVTGIPEKNSENLQLLRYQEGQYYGVHHDLIPHQLERQSGLRILTLYIYLNDVEEGGGTDFPRLGLTVTPKKGSAVLWPSVLNENPDAKDDRTEHQALPVIKGVKYGANAWIHQHDFKTPNNNGCS